MNILVTGGAGYIGSFMTRRLLDEGFGVTVIDSLEKGHREAVDKRAEFIKGDIKDKKFLEEVFSRSKFHSVIHFAGYISVEESARNPQKYFLNNTKGSEDLLETMCEIGKVDSFIFSSTAAVYGNPTKVPIPEDHPRNPTSPYGKSKVEVENLLFKYQKEKGVNFVILRYFNASGASLDGSMGEAHSPETHIIPKAVFSAVSNSEFKLFGDTYNTNDGTCIRDYIHVLDLVESHMLALGKLRENKGGFIYNVGTGKGYSNKEVIGMVKKVSGVDFPVLVSEKRPGDADVLVADSSKIRGELGFSPKYSDLEIIVKSAWKWHNRSSKFKTQNSK